LFHRIERFIYLSRSLLIGIELVRVGYEGENEMVYSTEAQVYKATGMSTTIIQSLSGTDASAVSTQIVEYIAHADQRIKRLLGIPYTVKKEFHTFHEQHTCQLGPEEDNFEFFGDYDPENLAEKIYAVYIKGGRMKLPYPKDCDILTEGITGWASVLNATLSAESTIVKCGTKSIKCIFSAAGSFKYTSHFDKNIEAWDYIGFWLYTSDEAAVFTITLEDTDGYSTSKTFSNLIKDTWQLVKLHIEDFTKGTGFTEWDYDHKLQHITIASSKACTIYFDNFCFNDGLFWTIPSGTINWSDPDTDPSDTEVMVTYSYDPFKLSVPVDIALASAKMAGILLLEYLIGCRQRITAFQQSSDALDNYPDRETLEFTKARLEREIIEILAGTGFKTYNGSSSE
jgi:hypothetical protein